MEKNGWEIERKMFFFFELLFLYIKLLQESLSLRRLKM
jgi:hypothetical protein